jgi:hypothetical protein
MSLDLLASSIDPNQLLMDEKLDKGIIIIIIFITIIIIAMKHVLSPMMPDMILKKL